MIWFLKFESAKVKYFIRRGVGRVENFQQGMGSLNGEIPVIGRIKGTGIMDPDESGGMMEGWKDSKGQEGKLER